MTLAMVKIAAPSRPATSASPTARTTATTVSSWPSHSRSSSTSVTSGRWRQRGEPGLAPGARAPPSAGRAPISSEAGSGSSCQPADQVRRGSGKTSWKRLRAAAGGRPARPSAPTARRARLGGQPPQVGLRRSPAQVDHHPHLPPPALDRGREVAAHQQEGAADEQADRDGEDREQAHLPAPQQVDRRLAEEVAEGLEEAHSAAPPAGAVGVSGIGAAGEVRAGASALPASRRSSAGGSVPTSSWSATRRPRSSVSTRRPTRWMVSRSWVARITVVPRRLTSRKSAEDLPRQVGVEVAGGLVGDQDVRLVDQRAGDRHPLLLAARELGREGVQAMGEPHPAQRLVGELLLLLAVDARGCAAGR